MGIEILNSKDADEIEEVLRDHFFNEGIPELDQFCFENVVDTEIGITTNTSIEGNCTIEVTWGNDVDDCFPMDFKINLDNQIVEKITYDIDFKNISK